jgi:hypothetical protein
MKEGYLESTDVCIENREFNNNNNIYQVFR